jgi:hypothetical protein
LKAALTLLSWSASAFAQRRTVAITVDDRNISPPEAILLHDNLLTSELIE